MNRLDPVPHSKVADAPAELKFGCPVCDAHFAARNGHFFLTYWYAENEHGERERKSGYLCFDKLACILCFVDDEESGHC